MPKLPNRAAMQAHILAAEAACERRDAEIAKLNEALQDERNGRKLDAIGHQKEAERRDALIASLRDDLMEATVQNAILDGYITRANESDPLPPAPQHRQFGPRVEAQYRGEERTSPGSVMTAYGEPDRRLTRPWWNRG